MADNRQRALPRWLVAPATFALAAGLTACQPGAGDRMGHGAGAAAGALHKLAGPTMGSTYHISYVSPPGSAAVPPERVQAAVLGILDEVDNAVSTYRDDSALARFNAADAGACMHMPEAALALADYAQALAQSSGGAYDVTLMPLLEAWGFAHRKTADDAPPQAPNAATLTALRQRMGMQHLRVGKARGAAPGAQNGADAPPNTPAGAPPDTHRAPDGQLCKDAPIRVEFNSIAAGYAVDRIAQQLQDMGVRSYLLEVTGEMRAAGRKPDGTPWRVAIEAPVTQGRQVQKILSLDGWALSTSGDYRNWREVNGQRYSHTMDPRQMRPVRHALASVTVAAPTALQADGLSTLLMVLGPQEGFAYAQQHRIAALFVTHAGTGFATRSTAAFDAAFDSGAPS